MIGVQSNRSVNRYYGLDKVLEDVAGKLSFYFDTRDMQYYEITDEHLDEEYAHPFYRIVIEAIPKVKKGI